MVQNFFKSSEQKTIDPRYVNGSIIMVSNLWIEINLEVNLSTIDDNCSGFYLEIGHTLGDRWVKMGIYFCCCLWFTASEGMCGSNVVQ